MSLLPVVFFLFSFGPLFGQVDYRAVEALQDWIDSRPGRKAFKDAGEIVPPKWTKSTKIGYLQFDRLTLDKGRESWWVPKRIPDRFGKDFRVTRYDNWKTETRRVPLRSLNGKIIGYQDVPRDIPGEYKSKEQYLLRDIGSIEFRDAVETMIFVRVRNNEFRTVGEWSEIKKRLRPPKSREEIEKEREQRLEERARQREEKKAEKNKSDGQSSGKSSPSDYERLSEEIGKIKTGVTTRQQLIEALGTSFTEEKKSVDGVELSRLTWRTKNPETGGKSGVRITLKDDLVVFVKVAGLDPR